MKNFTYFSAEYFQARCQCSSIRKIAFHERYPTVLVTIDVREGEWIRKCPYILLVNLAYRARPGCIGILNTLFRSFCEFPVACIWIQKAITPLGALG